MARPVRIHIPNSTYLVQLLPESQSNLFLTDEERYLFMDCMSHSAERFQVSIYAFALMDRAILIYLKNSHIPLSKFVHHLIVSYVNRLRVQRPVKKLIRDRHREILVEQGDLFLPMVKRVHLSPVIGGKWSNASSGRKWGEINMNPWTSLGILSGEEQGFPGFDTDSVLAHFKAEDGSEPEQSFYDFLAEGVSETGNDILDNVVHMSLLGSPQFIRMHKNHAKGTWRLNNGGISGDSEMIFEKIVGLVLDLFKGERDHLLKARSRHPGRKHLCRLASRYAIDEGGMKELGAKMNVSGSAMAHQLRIFQCELESDAALSNQVDELEGELKTWLKDRSLDSR